MKKFLIIAMLLITILTGCGKKEEEDVDMSEGVIEGISYKETDEVTNYIKIKVEGYKEPIIVQLYPDVAPITVANFQKLVSEKFYDGLIFHRVIDNFMIQTGDPTGTGYGGSEETIVGEFRRNGYTNNLKHERGVLSMARSNDMDSASSQFFIVQTTYPSLDDLYASFGRVLAGMDTVDEIAKVETDEYDKPIEEVKIKSIRFINVEEE